MKKINKGDIVGRTSYNKDILFIVERIITLKNNLDIAVLKGLTVRIEADSPVEDLEIIEKAIVESNFKRLDNCLESRANKFIGVNINSLEKFKKESLKDDRLKQIIYTGRILHLDGDKKYADKSSNYYRRLGLTAIVKNIPENKQAFLVNGLLKRYNPDILVITGHDGMIKNGTGYNDIYNYRNSRYFINTVKESRRWDVNRKLVIFAGACQSYFEALIEAGANFASSPARVLIDFIDPLIVAEKVATTDKYKYVTINDIAYELRDGKEGIGGIGANGKKEILQL